MDLPFQAYRGDEPYVFVCYAHADADTVYPEITRLHDEGVRICYDEGISPGELFTDELAEFIEGAATFLYVVTPSSVESRNCLNEVQFATTRNKRIVAVHLEQTVLPKGLELSIGLAQAILKHRLRPEDYQRKLGTALTDSGPSASHTAPAKVPVRRPARSAVMFAGALVAIMACVYLASILLSPDDAKVTVQDSPEHVSAVAVLPFTNVGDDPDQIYFSDGLTVDIIGNLQKLRLFPVIAHSSTFAYRDQAVDIKTLGNLLDATYVVEGTVRRSGDRLRVTAQLLDAATGYTVWSETYDRLFDDVFTLQDDITRSIAASISPEIQRAEMERARSRPTDNLTAYDLYLKGLRLAPTSAADVQQAREFLLEAAKLDPTFAHPWVRLAWMEHDLLTYYGPDSNIEDFPEIRRQALDFADRAVRLDPQLADGRVIRAHMLLHFKRVDEALEEYGRALALNPSSAEAIAQHAWGLIVGGEYQEGIDEMQRAKRLSPNDPKMFEYLLNEAWAFGWMGDYARCIELIQESLALNSDNLFAYASLVTAYLKTDQLEKAREAYRILEDQFPGFTTRSWSYSSIPEPHYTEWVQDLAAMGWQDP